jgi:hypothetical protein
VVRLRGQGGGHIKHREARTVVVAEARHRGLLDDGGFVNGDAAALQQLLQVVVVVQA